MGFVFHHRYLDLNYDTPTPAHIDDGLAHPLRVASTINIIYIGFLVN